MDLGFRKMQGISWDSGQLLLREEGCASGTSYRHNGCLYCTHIRSPQTVFIRRVLGQVLFEHHLPRLPGSRFTCVSQNAYSSSSHSSKLSCPAYRNVLWAYFAVRITPCIIRTLRYLHRYCWRFKSSWMLTPCCWVNRSRRFEGSECLHLHDQQSKWTQRHSVTSQKTLNLDACVNHVFNHSFIFFPPPSPLHMAGKYYCSLGFRIVEVSRHTTLTRDTDPCPPSPRRDSNPQSTQASGLRPAP